MTYIAVIAPGSLLTGTDLFSSRRWQMALAGELQLEVGSPSTSYQNFYRNGQRPSDRWLIMDNGAWENETLAPSILNILAREFHADEVVAPDVLNDAQATFTKTAAYLLKTSQIAYRSIAVVVQGPTWKDAKGFVDRIDSLDDTRVRTIMIGRSFSRCLDSPQARATMTHWIKNTYGDRYDVHLLGYNDDWGHQELHECQGEVRSLDTAAPIIAAYHGVPLDIAGTTTGPRPKYFFQLAVKDFDLGLVEFNMEVLDEWAGAKDWRDNK